MGEEDGESERFSRQSRSPARVTQQVTMSGRQSVAVDGMQSQE